MFSYDHSIPGVGHYQQNGQPTCIMCNYMMNDFNLYERYLLLCFLRFVIPSPFNWTDKVTSDPARLIVLEDIFLEMRKRSFKSNRTFSLEWETFLNWINIQRDTCAISGIVGCWKKTTDLNRVLRLSVDRINPQLGYEFTNMQVILLQLNRVKNKDCQEEAKLLV